MQKALQIQTQVDQALVDAIPAFKPLLGHRVQMIALDLEQSQGAATPRDVGPSQEVGAEAQPQGKISFEEFLATRPAWPEDRPPLTLEEMEQGIIQGAIHSASL
jgi:hypothetical protein